MTERPTDNSEKKIPARDEAGETGTGPVIPAGKSGTAGIRKHPAPRPVQRATALLGLGIGRPPELMSSVRRRTQMALYEKDGEIPYVKFELVARDLVCSLMERQDRMNEAIFYQINDLRYRIEDLEEARPAAGGGS